jgi:exodeoxyribonuclease VIII
MTETKRLIVEPEREYHEMSAAGECLSSHLLAKFRACPREFFLHMCGDKTWEQKPEYILGSAAHKLILEGEDVYAESYVTGGPVNEKTGKPYGTDSQAFSKWAQEYRDKGMEVISTDDDLLVRRMNAAVREHPVAPLLICNGQAEGVARGVLADEPCQARIDYFSEEMGLCDLKSTADLDRFRRDMFSFGYLNQVSFYWDVLHAYTGVRYPVHIIAAEKKEPYRVAVYAIHESSLMKAHEENVAAIKELHECRATGIWPTRYEDVIDIFYTEPRI